ncbi:Cys-tRNA(Pro) deacylase [Williamwhitmania taraxaci]|uniref:Cys-tRNA(Pro)/Cys-tRNA(Cys) deacylase n=1 Tax=Williamwhitmania taraxaci TaxID=1640674 RepID=A0A1G6JZB5_9BACT|nr:Cys-tRNA(Pro) deacylase [Williamwhitmania taraxaci]SDC24149.1 Cys-tRNA(Pro)/Cys-tRNA(Cys) deacylase [Williamwhitmania taraxaci]
MAAKKTNAARILDQMGIHYSIAEYQVDEADLSATHVADIIGQSPDIIFKTLVARGEKKGIAVFIIPGGDELNLKAAAQAIGDKKVSMIQVKELMPLTGYIRGGCSPLGMKKNFPTYVHDSVLSYPEVYVSAGVRGMQLVISPKDLIRATNATTWKLID